MFLDLGDWTREKILLWLLMFLRYTKRTMGVHTVIFGVLAMNTPNFNEVTSVSFDFFGINWLNCGIDTTVIVDVSAVNLKKYGVHTVNVSGFRNKPF